MLELSIKMASLGEKMQNGVYDGICEALSNVNEYLIAQLDKKGVLDPKYSKYTFSWLGRLDDTTLSVVFKTATPSRFSHTTSHEITQESHDIIFFSLAMEVLQKRQYVIRHIEKRESFPTRRTSDPIYSCVVSFALYNNDKAYGTFSIYADETINENEIGKLKSLAKDMAIMVDSENREELLKCLRVY